MDFHNLIYWVQQDTLGSLRLFAPELALCATAVALLLLRMLLPRLQNPMIIALLGALAGFWLAAAQMHNPQLPQQAELFTGLLVFDPFMVFFRVFLLAFLVLFVIFTWRSGIPRPEDATDFYVLAVGATLGMCLMTSANNLLAIFLAVEMASVPSYALAGILKGRRDSSEAALKFSVYGAGAAGVMLYGISLLGGSLGSLHLPTLAARLGQVLAGQAGEVGQVVLVLGGLMIMVGLAFKLSAFPFHFWAPDVFHGAAAEVGGFLSVASKAAALALLVRTAVGLSYVPPETPSVASRPGAQQAQVQSLPAGVVEAEKAPAAKIVPVAFAPAGGEHQPGHAAPAQQAPAGEAPALDRAELNQALGPARRFAAYVIGLLAALTATFGNLAAYGQTNIKRLLGYSTIAHAGYMMMPVAAALMLQGDGARGALATLLFYVVVYLFMNLTAFYIVAVLRNRLGSEEIADYAGLIRQSPGLVVCFAAVFFSLIGLPPLAGFAAKFAILASLADARLWPVLVVAGLNTALSLFYYLRVVKVMTMDPAPESQPQVSVPLVRSADGLFALVLSLPLLVIGVYWNGVFAWATAAVEPLFR